MRHLRVYESYDIEGWTESDLGLTKTFAFDSFSQAAEFVQEVADVAEELDHHPRIDWDYVKVKIVTRSHDVDSLTGRDYRLASALDSLV